MLSLSCQLLTHLGGSATPPSIFPKQVDILPVTGYYTHMTQTTTQTARAAAMTIDEARSVVRDVWHVWFGVDAPADSTRAARCILSASASPDGISRAAHMVERHGW